MPPPTARRRGGGELTTRQHPLPAEPGRLFFMPAPPGRHHRPPPSTADRDRPFFMPTPAPPGRRSHSNQPPPSSDPPPSASATSRPQPPHPHAYVAAASPASPRATTPTPTPPAIPVLHCTSALASCLVATAFLLLSMVIASTALFLLFRPQPPDIAVAAVRLPSFSASNGTVAFTFEQTATVRNPNRSPLAHFDSCLRVAYAGGELGAVYIPAGLIDGGRTKHVSAVFDVPAIPVADAQQTMIAAASVAQQQQVIEVHSLLVVKGRVKVLRVRVSPLDGTVLAFRC